MRTDNNNNPTAFTTDVAKTAGLTLGVDYVVGDPFPPPSHLITAKLLGDPILLTIGVIDRIGFKTTWGSNRWAYMDMPKFIWDRMDHVTKVDTIGWMYQREGGIAMRNLFPNYGRLL